MQFQEVFLCNRMESVLEIQVSMRPCDVNDKGARIVVNFNTPYSLGLFGVHLT